MRRLALCSCALLHLGLFVSCSWAAFPGRNGLLVVQPTSGRGLIVVSADGRTARRVCTDRPVCYALARPRWSPDGRVIGLQAAADVGQAPPGPVLDLIYPDGSCMLCAPWEQQGYSGPSDGIGSAPAFTPDPTLLTFVSGGQLWEAGIDGLVSSQPLMGGVTDAVWSAQGKLAVVRSGQVWAGRPHSLVRLGAGRSPTWAPDGTHVAFVRRGWVVVERLGARSVRRLARGSSPAWSPDGRLIAFISVGHGLRVIRAAGGRARRVGRVPGVSVDWQSLPRTPGSNCAAPPGATILAQSTDGVIFSHSRAGGSEPDSAFMGCLRSSGRQRLLENPGPYDYDYVVTVPQAVIAGYLTGLVNHTENPHYGGQSTTLKIFDLRTGTAVAGGGETVACSDYSCANDIDHAVLGPDGVSAVHTEQFCYQPPPDGIGCWQEQIIANDSTGTHTLDAATTRGSLTNLTLTADTLTWQHDGTPKSAPLQP